MSEGTRSGLLWQVERILTECKELEKLGKGYMPNVLLMENVIQVHSEKDMEHFRKWINRLEELGYQNYWQDLIATDYGIPQTRNRCFMVSIYGDYSYTFPKPISLKLVLNDLKEPEENVDEKFYISEKMFNYISKTGGGDITTKMRQSIKKSQDHLPPSQIKEQELQITSVRVYPEEFDLSLLIKCNNKKGYAKAEIGDGVDISSRMATHRGTVQKGKIQTLTTQGKDCGIVVGKVRKIKEST